MTNHHKAFFSLLLAGLVYGTFGLFVRILSKSFGPFEQILYRCSVGALLGILLIIITRTKLEYSKVAWKDLVLYTCTFPFAVILFTVAVGYNKVSTLTFLFYASSLISSYVIGIKLFHEKITGRKNIALVLSLIGLCFYMIPFSLGTSFLAIVLILGAGLIDTLSSTYKKRITGKISSYALLPLPLIGASIVSGLLVLLFGEHLHPSLFFRPHNFAIYFGYGFTILLLTSLVLFGFRHFDLNLGTLVLSSELVFATLVGMLFLAEVPTFKEIIGGAFIIGAIVVANWPINKQATR